MKFLFLLAFCIFSFSQTLKLGSKSKKQMAEYSNKHHGKDGFISPYLDHEAESERSFLKLASFLFKQAVLDHGGEETELVRRNRSDFENRSGIKITWLGHASVLIQVGELNILCDPVFSRVAGMNNIGPRREVGIAIQVDSLPQIHFVLISHNHYDHLDKKTILSLDRNFKPQFLIPLEMGRHFKDWEINSYIEMDWWNYFELTKDVSIYCTPANHWSVRNGFDRNEVLWSSWLIRYQGKQIYFAGDTGSGGHFKEIRDAFGKMTVSILPIGPNTPRWLMKVHHINPKEAIEAHRILGSDYFIPIHWGTYNQGAEALDAPLEELEKELEKEDDLDAFRILPVGGQFLLKDASLSEMD